MSIKLVDIETAAKEFSIKSKKLRNIKETLDADIDSIKNKYIDDLKAVSIEAGEAYQMLLTLVSDAEILFLDKKSMTINGVKCGFQKKKGKIEIVNEQTTINKIKELFEDRADIYLNNKISISKKALDSMTASDLKKIGVNIIQDTSEPFVRLVDDDVQKLIESIIKESAKVAE